MGNGVMHMPPVEYAMLTWPAANLNIKDPAQDVELRESG
jgi:hypothetical protein